MVTYRIALGSEFDTAPDDTEEPLVGSSAHQGAIIALATGLTLHARRHRLPWHVGNQLTVVVPRLSGGPPYQPAPDILVHPTLGPDPLPSLNVGTSGPPALIIEVASPSTARERDLNLREPRGKPALYAAMGVEEYLVFDPLGDFLPEQVRAWRAASGGTAPGTPFVPWKPRSDGRWASRALGVAFAPQGFLLRVYGPDGALLPVSEELDDRNRTLAAENHRMADLVDEQARRMAALEAEIRRLRGGRTDG